MVRRYFAVLLSLGLPVLFPAVGSIGAAPDGSRFEEAKRLALQFIESDQFDRAAAKLEEVWEQDKTDPVVAENLAVAYLNGEDRRYHPAVEDKARQVMKAAIKLGGKATFLVQHRHEGKVEVIVIGRDSLRYCNGRLSLESGKVRFIMKPLKGAKEDHSFDATTEQLRTSGRDNASTFTLSRGVGNDKGKSSWKRYTMEPRNGNPADSKLIRALLDEYVGGQKQ